MVQHCLEEGLEDGLGRTFSESDRTPLGPDWESSTAPSEPSNYSYAAHGDPRRLMGTYWVCTCCMFDWTYAQKVPKLHPMFCYVPFIFRCVYCLIFIKIL